MKFLEITDHEQKVNFVQSSGGTELSTFWEKEARIQWEVSADPELTAHTYEEVVAESKRAFLKYLSCDRAIIIIDLLHMP